MLLMNRGRSSSISQQSFLHPALFSFLFEHKFILRIKLVIPMKKIAEER